MSLVQINSNTIVNTIQITTIDKLTDTSLNIRFTNGHFIRVNIKMSEILKKLNQTHESQELLNEALYGESGGVL